MTESLGLTCYLLISRNAAGVAKFVASSRLRRGKEHSERFQERLGQPSRNRPPGPLVWFHGASIGEAKSVTALLEDLRNARRDLSFLLTTGTVSSAQILAKQMPPYAMHQFFPYDVVPAIQNFLGHWKPSVGVWLESEFWPAHICEAHRSGVPLVLLNARISSNTVRKWKFAPRFSRSMLRRFHRVHVQNEETWNSLSAMGLDVSKMEVTGTLKKTSTSLPYDSGEYEIQKENLKNRNVWVAASTHAGEEEIALRAQLLLRKKLKDTLLIIVPRDIKRTEEIVVTASELGFSPFVRSSGQSPGGSTDAYIADTWGELGLWYRLSRVAMVGGSMVPIGGHNPYEPASCDCAIIHGKHTKNFQEVYAELHSGGGSVLAGTPSELACAVEAALDPAVHAQMVEAARQIFVGSNEPMTRATELILSLLPNQPAGIQNMANAVGR
ncbi:MAG: 3-deoxy-D-manno-octulosonic acid transferase [Rhodobacteraceae bacterium]|nr:3-deoxy-D-manno-octulosonic acid transferase [Paracoccaceae bacterium]